MPLRIISSSGYVANACIDCNLDYPNMIFGEFFSIKYQKNFLKNGSTMRVSAILPFSYLVLMFFSIKYQKFYTNKWLNHAGFSDFRNFLFGFYFLMENFSSLSTKNFFQKIQYLCGFQRFCHFLI